MSPTVESKVEGEVRVRHRLAYPAFPERVAEASREARRAMRMPLLLTAGAGLAMLTAMLGGLVLVRPVAAATALLFCAAIHLLRTRGGYDAVTGWSWRFGILGGALGELGTQLLVQASATSTPWPWILTDALGVGGAVGLGVALATSTWLVVGAFLYATATFPRVNELHG